MIEHILKKDRVLIMLFAVIFIFSVSDYLQGADGDFSYQEKIIRGERPYIDLDTVPSYAYETGRLYIKFQRHMEEKKIDYITAEKGMNYVITGIHELDDLNMEFSVKSYKPFLNALYEVSPRSMAYEKRHREWGFHLWYELVLDDKTDIIEAVRAFSRSKNIEIAEPVFKKQLILPVFTEEIPVNDNESRWIPNDPLYADNQWHFNNTGQNIQGQTGIPGADIDAENAWEIETGYDEVIVAVIDGGIDFQHQDLNANMWSEIGPDGTGTQPCSQEHGTHVGGTVAAVTNNSVGVAGIAGGDGSGNGIRLMSIDLFAGSHGLNTLGMNIYAADNGAAISQNSWGYIYANYYNQSDLDGIDYFNQHGGGDVLDGGITIFAAGNSNSSGNWYPAFYSGAMAVASTDNRDIKSSFSNYGSWIEISAPGSDIASTGNNNSYRWMSGTSMACPHVSGVAALMISYTARNAIILSADEVRDILKETADDHYDQNSGYIGQLGAGRLNAYNALMVLQDYVSGIINPSNFTAEGISESQIQLSWQKNDDNNNVMILWSEDNVFGTPESGIVYTIGSSIPGGGFVLYRGSNNSYTHSGLQPANRYYYRAFSYDNSNEYSSGRGTSGTTLCGIYNILPFFEDFNQSAQIPLCWENIDHQGNGQIWQVGTISNGLTGTTGNYAYLNSDGYGSGNTQNADLVTPTLDLSAYTDISLSFKHYFRVWQNETATLSYSIDNGNTWQIIQTWTSSTSSSANFDQMIPAVDGQSHVRFKWNYTGSYGWYWCIDDVLIEGQVSGTIPNNPSDLEAMALSQSKISLSWTDNSDDEIGFKIERKTGSAGSWSQIAIVGSNITNYDNTGLSSDTIYYYRVRSYNAVGNSDFSNEAHATTYSEFDESVSVYRFFNTSSGGHLYTISDYERDYIIDSLPDWSYEGISFEVFLEKVPGTTPAFRFFNTGTGIHIYTISEPERDAIMELPEWNYEGVSFYVYEERISGSIPVFRFFNHVRGGHLYTISEFERDAVMELNEWNYEGEAFFVIAIE